MDQSLLDPADSDRRRWTLLAAVTFGLGALGCAILIWGAVLALLWTGTGSLGGEDPVVVGLVVAWALGSPVLGGVTIGTPLWYVLVERLGVESLSDESVWAYPTLGAVAGLGAGVLSHLVVWGIAGVAGGLASALGGDGGAGLLTLGAFAATYSVVLFGWLTGLVGTAAGGLLGYLRHRGRLPGPLEGSAWKQVT